MTKTKDFFWQTAEKGGAYQAWRSARLAAAEAALAADFVEIGDLERPATGEIEELVRRCNAANLALYASDGAGDTRAALRGFAAAFGLTIAERHRSRGGDGIVALKVSEAPAQRGYIPYSRRKMNWHTDGYYNPAEARISAMVLHTETPAGDGGANRLLDHAVAYIRLMDENPAYVRALMHPGAMTIPANEDDARPASVGPVFFADAETGALQMRYTARTRSIAWRDDPLTREAVACLGEVLAAPDPLTLALRFGPGQGVLCNNVLHDRTGFDTIVTTSATTATAPSPRCVYRIRFHNRVKGPQ